MITINQLIAQFHAKVTQLVLAKETEFDSVGFATIVRPAEVKRFYPSEFPTWNLQGFLLSPENRTILLEFLRRYHRDEILQKALGSLIQDNASDLYAHFAEVPDFLHLVGAIQNEQNLAEYLSDYDLHAHLMPSSIPQKNYKDFVVIVQWLKDYANDMTHPEAKALVELQDKNIINRSQVVTLMHELTAVPNKRPPVAIPNAHPERITARYQRYHSVLNQMYAGLIEYFEKQALYLLSQNSYQQAFQEIREPEIKASLSRFQTNFQRFYAPDLTHSERKNVLAVMDASVPRSNACLLFRAMSKVYDRFVKAYAYELPIIFLGARSLPEAQFRILATEPGNPVQQSHLRSMRDVIAKYPASLQRFFMETNPQHKAQVFDALLSAMRQANPAASVEHFYTISSIKEYYMLIQVRQEDELLDEASNNQSPVNNATSPVSKFK